MKNVILIGMPAVGKTTIGKRIASQLNMHFIDTDDVIREACMTTLPDLLTKYGLDGFKKIEERVICDCNYTNAVIATGGSAVYGEKAMEHLKKNGVVVYLQISYEEIEKRLGRMKSRGVAIKEGQTLESLYQERKILYEKYADITIDVNGNSIPQTLESSLLKLKEIM